VSKFRVKINKQLLIIFLKSLQIKLSSKKIFMALFQIEVKFKIYLNFNKDNNHEKIFEKKKKFIFKLLYVNFNNFNHNFINLKHFKINFYHN